MSNNKAPGKLKWTFPAFQFNSNCRTLLCRPLKFKFGSVAKLFCDLSPSVLKFYSKEKFKTLFYSKLGIKACKRLKNDFKLIRFAFEVRQKFEAVPREWNRY